MTVRAIFYWSVCIALVISQTFLSVARADDAHKVVTYNIRYANTNDGEDVWPNRADSVIKFIGENDIIGLQEVTLAQLNELRDGLKNFDSYGVGRKDGKQGGEHAPIFYRSSRFELIDQGTFWLSEAPNEVGSKGWDAALPRTCTWMTLRDKSSGVRFWVANTHFDHRGRRARAESAKLIRRTALEMAGDLPTIVMGDFNCIHDSDPYRSITASGDAGETFADARDASDTEPAGEAGTWNGFDEIVPGRIIDHIFVRGPLQVASLETLNPMTEAGRFASDHLPVRAMVRLSGDDAASSTTR